MFWPLARILFTTKERSGCLTQLGREREREGEKEGKREHLCETLPFTSSLGIRGGKSRERRYIYIREVREPNLRDDLLTKALPFCENLWNVSIRNEPREFSKFHCGGVRIVFICIHALVISNTDVKGKFILFLLWWFSFLDFWRIFIEFEDKFFIENCRISFFSFNRIWRILFEIVTAMVESLFKFYPGEGK